MEIGAIFIKFAPAILHKILAGSGVSGVTTLNMAGEALVGVRDVEFSTCITKLAEPKHVVLAELVNGGHFQISFLKYV